MATTTAVANEGSANWGAIDGKQTTLCKRHCKAKAEQTVAAYALLMEIEGRTASVSASEVDVTSLEIRFLASAGVDVVDRQTLSRQLLKIRAARTLVLEGTSRDAIEDAKARLEESKEAELSADADLGDVDTPDESGPVLAKHIAALENKLAGLRGRREAAEKRVESLKRKYEVLLRHAPSPLQEIAEERERKLRQSNVGRDIRKLHHRIRDLRKSLDPVMTFGLVGGGAFADRGRDQAFCDYLHRALPDAIRGDANGFEPARIDGERVAAHIEELSTVTLPALIEEEAQATREWTQSFDECRAPLHEWAATGVLTVEMLTAP